MSEINRKKLNPIWTASIVIVALFNFAVLIKILLQGKNIAILNPKGWIAHEQYNLLVFTTAVLLVVMIPTLLFLFFVAWRYRDTHSKIKAPKPNRSKFLVFGMWAFPTAIMLLLASVMIPATHRLAPQNAIASDVEPITIQVVSLRWKWLFIYPEQGIASVNFVEVPINTPIHFELTADEAPMSSFWIPNLGGQLYTMTGMVNRLNLMADVPGDYPGSSAEINGAGFAGMKFTARASYNENFDKWVEQVKQSPQKLDEVSYKNLVQPSENHPVEFFSAYENGLYDKVVMKYRPDGHGHEEKPAEEGEMSH